MKKKETFPDYLKSATKAVKRTAKRNGLSIAISENGKVKIISPEKKNKPVQRISTHKQSV